MIKKLLLGSVLLLSACISYSQADPRLAQQYFRDGEYEKASTLYQQLWQNNSGSDYYFDRLMDCYFALEDYDQAESLIKKQIRKHQNRSQTRAALEGWLWSGTVAAHRGAQPPNWLDPDLEPDLGLALIVG